MADEDSDLVSQVRVEGVDEATAKLKAYGDAGAAAFDKIGDASKKTAQEVEKSSSAIESNAGVMTDWTQAIRTTGLSSKEAAAGLKEIEAAARKLGSNVRSTVKDLAQFAAKVAGVVTAATAAGGALLVMAGNAAKSVQQTTSAFEKNNKAQQEAVQNNLSATQGAIQYAAQQQLLNRQLADGTITYDQYSSSLKANKRAYQDQIKVTAQLQAAQEDAQRETEKLQQTLANQKALQELQERFGGPLASSIIQIGNAVNTFKNSFVQAFSPAIAALVDSVAASLQASGTAINAFFDQAAGKIATFVSQNGPAIQQALASIGTAMAAVFNGVIAAAPVLLGVFNNQIVPAFKAVAAAADAVTQTINNLFGTQFTTGALVIVAAITSMLGGFKVLFGLLGVGISTFNTFAAALRLLPFIISPLSIAITAVIVALTLLYQNWDTITKAMGTLWTGFVTIVTDSVNTVVKFFSDLPATIGGIFTAIGTAIQNGFISAFDAVKNYLLSWVDTIKGILQPLIDMIKAIGSGTSDAGGADNAPGFAKGGKIRGAGTSTSDSILAWLSNSEYVVRAKAVRKYGTAFLNAINTGRLDLAGIVKGFAGGGTPFAGLSPAPMAALATSGGPRGGGGVLNLTIGDQSFNGLTMPDDETADSLTRYAVQQQIASAGRKPSWKTARR